MRFSILALLLLASATPAWAQTAAEPSLVALLSRCDGSFFKALQAQPKRVAAQGAVQPRGEAATFLVPNITHPTDSKVFFETPLKLHGVDLIGWFDELTPIPGGVAVSWGFLVAASVDATAERLKPVLWEGPRLRSGDGYFVRSEIWRHANAAAGWAKEATEPGPPQPGTVERVFMIEPYDGETSFIRAGCSLQGEVSRDMIRELRPDFPSGPART